MKAIIKYFDEGDYILWNGRSNFLPLLEFQIHGAPHKRQHRAVIQKYREDLYSLASRRLKIVLPIDYPLQVSVLFTNPNSPDIDHLVEALYMALDGKTLEGPSILVDDRLIQGIYADKYYPHEPTKRDGDR
jgi:hypothetical protein